MPTYIYYDTGIVSRKKRMKPMTGLTVVKSAIKDLRFKFHDDVVYLFAPALILNRRLSMRPSQEELEERNILKSKAFLSDICF